jgi:DNA-binding transcriptional ArsR family regulator
VALVQLDAVFRALADPTRRWIIEQLLRHDQWAGRLGAAHAMSLTAFMRHVHVLEQCGLVRTRKEGRARRCRIEAEPLRAAEQWMRHALWAGCRIRLGSLPEDWGQR